CAGRIQHLPASGWARLGAVTAIAAPSFAALLLAAISGVIAPAVAATSCPASPLPIRDLALDRYYGDKTGSEVDPARKAAHADATRPRVDYLRTVTDTADRAVARRDAAAASCAAAWLEAWARADALLGQMSGPQAQSQRKWDLAGLALAYLKIKPMLDTPTRAAIGPWLIRLADAAHAHAVESKSKRNNHWYWLGVSVGATALATGSARHWDIARGIMADAARDIAADGTLPLELQRGKRALHYHAFSVTALVTLAELGAARGEDWTAAGDGALHRLVRATVSGLADPAVFDRLAGVTQERPVNPGSGWLALYAARHPGRLPDTHPAIPARHRWLGGDVRVLADVLARLQSAP
ncbi:MAG: alginate lyase family protein, partial [Hyphomicrobium sp.]